MQEGLFFENQITAANLAEIAKEQSKLEEKRICEISELAYFAAETANQMLGDGYTVYEILSVLSEGIFTFEEKPHMNRLDENVLKLTEYIKITNTFDKVIFSEFFIKKLADFGVRLKEEDFLFSDKGNETVTYVKNALADEAYDVFTQDFTDPRVKYSQSLKHAVKAVSADEFEYCLLPLEERGGARIGTTAELLFSEDLKINSVTPVFGFEGLADMKYALVSKHFTIPEFTEGDDRYLEIRLRADSSASLSEIFLASDSLGALIYRVNGAEFATDEGPVAHYSVVLKSNSSDFCNILVYLTLFAGAYTPVGIYKNLE